LAPGLDGVGISAHPFLLSSGRFSPRLQQGMPRVGLAPLCKLTTLAEAGYTYTRDCGLAPP
jgi:hypothetical protein